MIAKIKSGMSKVPWSAVVLVLGIMYLFGSIAQVGRGSVHAVSGSIAGAAMILGSLAYRSAKKRKLKQAKRPRLRLVLEVIALTAIVALVGLQNNLLHLIESDPVPNFIIPLLVMIAYWRTLWKAKTRFMPSR